MPDRRSFLQSALAVVGATQVPAATSAPTPARTIIEIANALPVRR